MKTRGSYQQSDKNNFSNDELLARPMIHLEQCRAIMNRGGLQYTDEELLIMRDFLYRLAEIMMAAYDRKKEREIEEQKKEADSLPFL